MKIRNKNVYLKQSIVDEDVLVLSLDHVVPLGPQTSDMTVHVHRLLVLHPLQHAVDDDEGPGPADPRAAVGHDGAAVRGVEHVDAADELEEGGAVFRHSVVWPGRELELLHLSPVRVTHLKHNQS